MERGPEQPTISCLPDEILMQVFGHLARISTYEDDELWDGVPFRQPKVVLEPCTRLRGYPFLAQVCKRWRAVLDQPMTQSLVWREVVVDFGHELVTSIHTPLRWSNQRPTAAEFQSALQACSLSANKIVAFIRARQPHIRSLTLSSSEGFHRDDGHELEYISLAGDKHNFGATHLGFVIGLLQSNLQVLHLYQCNDLLNADGGVWTLVQQLPALRSLSVEGVNMRLPATALEQLGCLKQLDTLVITGEEHRHEWVVGLDVVPDAWSRLTALTCLELRGHQLLDSLPAWLPGLPSLRKLDVSSNAALSLGVVPQMTRLQVLVMQNLALAQKPAPGERGSTAPVKRWLPDLAPLAGSLTGLSLSMNAFSRVPEVLAKLTNLEFLDMSCNKDMHIVAPLHALASLPRIRVLDFRGVHVDKPTTPYWGPDKCVTMEQLSKLAKALKRKAPTHRLFFDRES